MRCEARTFYAVKFSDKDMHLFICNVTYVLFLAYLGTTVLYEIALFKGEREDITMFKHLFSPTSSRTSHVQAAILAASQCSERDA
jgi:hypothetical protein